MTISILRKKLATNPVANTKVPIGEYRHEAVCFELLPQSSEKQRTSVHKFVIPCYMTLLSGCQQLISKIIIEEPLTCEHITALSPHVPHYVIPHNQTKTGIRALILYSKEDRQGARAEADGLENALLAVGGSVTRVEWEDTRELGAVIDSSLEAIVGELCI